jgi:hypothetical protein
MTISPFSFFLTGVIAVVIFITFCIIGIMTRFLYQHKQSHRTNQMKEKEYPENLDSSFRNDIDLQNTVTECKREYFIWISTGSLDTFFLWLVLNSFLLLLSLLSFNFGHSLSLHVYFWNISVSPSIDPLNPAQESRQLWLLPSFVITCMVVKMTTWDTDFTILNKEETHVYLCIFTFLFQFLKCTLQFCSHSILQAYFELELCDLSI